MKPSYREMRAAWVALVELGIISGEVRPYGWPKGRLRRPDREAYAAELIEKRRNYRRRKGAIPREEYLAKSKSKTKPWLQQGISRATWFRRNK